MSDKYQAALVAVRQAGAKFNKVRDAYRMRRVGDAEFLAAKKVMDEATATFDLAFIAERDEDDARSVPR